VNHVHNYTQHLGVKLPIIQAPMAGVQDSQLAIAVAKAGGLGSLPCAMLSPQQIESELHKLTSATSAPINLNFFCHQPPESNAEIESRWQNTLSSYFDELGLDPQSIKPGASRQPFNHDIADVLEPHKPAIISFHFGLPSQELLKRVRAWGSTIISSATTVEEAVWLEQNGADLIIAQGIDAGGHRGMFLTQDLTSQVNTSLLLDKIQQKVGLPIIAAGGISTAEDVSKSLSTGAMAVQAGTAYLLCNEAKTSKLHQQAIQKTSSPSTCLTNLFSGRPARGIINRVIKELGAIHPNAPEFPLAATAMTTLRNAAEAQNSSDFTPLWCGQNTQGCEAISAYQQTLKLTSKL